MLRRVCPRVSIQHTALTGIRTIYPNQQYNSPYYIPVQSEAKRELIMPAWAINNRECVREIQTAYNHFISMQFQLCIANPTNQNLKRLSAAFYIGDLQPSIKQDKIKTYIILSIQKYDQDHNNLLSLYEQLDNLDLATPPICAKILSSEKALEAYQEWTKHSSPTNLFFLRKALNCEYKK